MGKVEAAGVLVVGGGPAGMMAAAAARLAGAGVALLEKNGRPGRKMAITGGGRCNLTNTAPPEEFIKKIPGNGKFVISALSRFSSRDCLDFFSSLGVPAREEGGRVFPAAHRAVDVVEALEKYLLKSGVNIHYLSRAEKLLLDRGRCRGVMAGGRSFYGKAVVVATGGASYPRTGSTGDGYLLARQGGHTVVPALPGLVPLCFADPRIGRSLQGLTVKNILLTLTGDGGEKLASGRGDVVFTHFGISGPAALGISREVSVRTFSGAGRLRLLVDLLPETAGGRLADDLLGKAGDQPKKTVAGLIRQILPVRLAVVVAGMIPEESRKRAAEAGKEVWRKISGLIKSLPLDLAGTRPLAEAMVTVGGVSTREVDPRTMASRLVEGLYFAGEVLDVDACTGGFNMQVAFSTGWVAGLSAAARAGFPAGF